MVRLENFWKTKKSSGMCWGRRIKVIIFQASGQIPFNLRLERRNRMNARRHWNTEGWREGWRKTIDGQNESSKMIHVQRECAAPQSVKKYLGSFGPTPRWLNQIWNTGVAATERKKYERMITSSAVV